MRWRLRAAARRTAQFTLPMSSVPGGGAAIMRGTPPPARGFTSAWFCARRFPQRVWRCCLLLPGLRLRDAIRECSGLVVDLRWPNDLLIGPRKTGGILVEAQTEAGGVAFAVAGIGINVHQRSFDPGLSTAGTSLDMEAGRTISRQALLVSLLESLEREAAGLADAEATETIPARVAAASTWVRGRSVEVHGPQACIGETAGLDENGFLLVRTDAGIVTVQTGGIRAAQTN